MPDGTLVSLLQRKRLNQELSGVSLTLGYVNLRYLSLWLLAVSCKFILEF